jgi:hypothetical protein
MHPLRKLRESGNATFDQMRALLDFMVPRLRNRLGYERP